MTDVGDFLEEEGKALLLSLGKSLPRTTDASGDLRESMKFFITRTKTGYVFELKMLDYFEAVDKGTQAGHYVPIKALEEWITVKRLVLTKKGLATRRPKSKLKVISEDLLLLRSTAYARQKKIFRKGTKGTDFYSSVVPQWVEGIKKKIGAAYVVEATYEITQKKQGSSYPTLF